MLTVKQLFIADGLGIPEDEIKLVRHVDHLNRSIQRVIDEGYFDRYQAEQAPTLNPFHGCKVILSFIGVEGNKAKFYGVYKVNSWKPFKKEDWAGMPDWLFEAHKDKRKRIFYDLEEIEDFRSYRERVIVQWKSTRGWVQMLGICFFSLGENTPHRPAFARGKGGCPLRIPASSVLVGFSQFFTGCDIDSGIGPN